MLFNVCNCVTPAAPISARCAPAAPVSSSAMMRRCSPPSAPRRRKTLRGDVPVVDRLAVRMVTDNIVIQFVANEKRDGLTIERKSGNTIPDRPPRTMLNGEWGLAMHAQSFAGETAPCA